VSSYTVEDRVQVADVDPSMIIDQVDVDTDTQPCPICGDSDNEEALLLCDGCDVASHIWCVGLDAIPSGAWYCDQCEEQRALGPVSDSPTRLSRSHGRSQHRTRAQQRRLRNTHWARVWQSVWDRLNPDQDFPFDDDRDADGIRQRRRRQASNQRDFRAWERRYRVAERQGAANRFRDTAALLDIDAPRPSRPRVPRAPTPEPESLEEIMAWNAFERARELENDPNAARKRKEPTLSPSPEPAEPERKLKRPRTRRPSQLAAMALQNGESSRAAREQVSARLNADNSGPSFLQSLLKEVEEAANPNRNGPYGPSVPASNAPPYNTPGPSSPFISPSPSNRSSPQLSSTTPPPHLRGRPISPVPLASPTDPVSPSSPEFSPSASPVRNSDEASQASHSHPNASNSGTGSLNRSSRQVTSRSNETSPTRTGPSLAVKSEVQKLVGASLKPFYRNRVVSKEEYTDINRTISRKLYKQVGNVESLDAEAKAKWESVASEEVKKAVEALKQKKEAATSANQHN